MNESADLLVMVQGLLARICGQDPQRSPLLFGHYFLCHRCLGFWLAFLAILAVHAFVRVSLSWRLLLGSGLVFSAAVVLMALDIYLFQHYIFNSVTRFLTGALLGGSSAWFMGLCIGALVRKPA